MRFLEANGGESLQALILSRGCYSPGENQRIHDKWFAAGPRRVFRSVDRRYGLTGRRIAGWEYPENNTRRVAENVQGFSFVGQTFGGQDQPPAP